jgi:hypothetical protein
MNYLFHRGNHNNPKDKEVNILKSQSHQGNRNRSNEVKIQIPGPSPLQSISNLSPSPFPSPSSHLILPRSTSVIASILRPFICLSKHEQKFNNIDYESDKQIVEKWWKNIYPMINLTNHKQDVELYFKLITTPSDNNPQKRTIYERPYLLIRTLHVHYDDADIVDMDASTNNVDKYIQFILSDHDFDYDIWNQINNYKNNFNLIGKSWTTTIEHISDRNRQKLRQRNSQLNSTDIESIGQIKWTVNAKYVDTKLLEYLQDIKNSTHHLIIKVFLLKEIIGYFPNQSSIVIKFSF